MATPVWYVDRGLEVLVKWAKDKWKGIVVGTIGNLAHQAEPSDHNPSTAKHDKGAVDAADFMLGTHFSLADAQWFVNTLVKYRDKRIAYIIWNGRIISSYAVGNVKAWVWRTYNGKDRHTNHVHVSVNDLHETDTSPWQMEEDDMPYTLDQIAKAVVKELESKTLGKSGPNWAQDVESIETVLSTVRTIQDDVAAIKAAVTNTEESKSNG